MTARERKKLRAGNKVRSEGTMLQAKLGYRELLESLQTIVWEADAATWQFLYVSQWAEAILGYPVEQWLNKPNFWVDHIHPEDRERAVACCREATARGEDHEFEYRAVAADGRAVWFRDIVRVIKDKEGRPQKLRGVMVDITERKHAEEEVQHQLQIISALQDINTAITSTLDLHTILTVLLEKIDLFLPYATATTVRLFDEESGLLEPLACRNIDEQEWRAEPWRGGRGIQRLVFESKAPQTIRNVETDPRMRDLEFYRKHKLISYLGVPLIVKDKVLGVLSLYTKEEHKFSDAEVGFLSTLAGQAAIAIHNSQLYEEVKASKAEMESINQRLERSLRELSSLYTALTPVAPAESVIEMLEKIINRLMEATGADAALIRLQDNISGTYPCAAQRGFPDYYLETVVNAPPGGPAAWVFQNAQPIIASDIAADSRLKGKVQLQVGLRSCAFLPLKARGEVRGIVHLASRRMGYFNEEQKNHLMAIARQMGIALENRDLFDELRASTDELGRANKDLKRREEIQALLKELSQDITSLEVDSLLRKLTGKVREFFKVDISDVRVLEKGTWQVLGVSGIESGQTQSDSTGTARGRSRWIIENRQPLLILDITKETEFSGGESISKAGIRGYLGIPLFSSGGEVMGILRALSYQPRDFTQEEVDLLQQIANGAAIALENARLLEQIKKQAAELAKANEVKNEFLGFVSHELRTPVNAVIGYTGMVKDRILGEINPQQESTLGKVIKRSEELLGMINTLMEAARIEAGAAKTNREEFRLHGFLDELKSTYDVPLDKELTLVWDYPSDLPAVTTDREKLRHILQNLVNNAIKYTDKGDVTISARIKEDGGTSASSVEPQQAEGSSNEGSILAPQASRLKFVEFKVADTGIGIPKEFLPTIFEMFRQVDGSKAGRRSGVGLGLHIVKKFTELLGGRVEVESEPGKGSIFTVTLPL